MFGIRRGQPPLTTFQRLDIELLMRRTVEVVGHREIGESTVVTDLSQLDLDRSSPQQLLATAKREVQARIPSGRAPCDYEIAQATQLGYPSTYQPATDERPAQIRIADETLSDPLLTVVELSYQCSSHFWHNVPNPMPLDTEPRTTHLMPIVCGLGVLASDASLIDKNWSQAGWSGWSITRCGYYTAVEIGYAMALLARLRGESNPKWAGALRLDSRDTARKAWRYFRRHKKTGGKLLFDSGRIPASTGDSGELALWLRGEDPTFALAAAFALLKMDDLPPLVIDAAIEASRCGDKDLAPVATRLLGRARHSSRPSEERLRELLRSDSPQEALAAIESADAIGMPLVEFGPRMAKWLDWFAQDAFPLIDVITRQGIAFEFMAPKICEHLARALRESDDDRADALLECLRGIATDPSRSIEQFIRTPQLREEAIERLASSGSNQAATR